MYIFEYVLLYVHGRYYHYLLQGNCFYLRFLSTIQKRCLYDNNPRSSIFIVYMGPRISIIHWSVCAFLYLRSFVDIIAFLWIIVIGAKQHIQNSNLSKWRSRIIHSCLLKLNCTVLTEDTIYRANWQPQLDSNLGLRTKLTTRFHCQFHMVLPTVS